MFTGIIEEVGSVKDIQVRGNFATIQIQCNTVLENTQIGDSIAVNGICLTVTSKSLHSFSADMMNETLKRSTMRIIRKGTKVNLERAMRLSDRLNGHIVSGHIDGVGKIIRIQKDALATLFTIQTDKQLTKYIVEKGSIAIDGISLTVVKVNAISFQVSIIPHTIQNTILITKHIGDLVNLETDIFAKYIVQNKEKQTI